MPAKGQKCANCTGDCCSVVIFTGFTISHQKKDLMDFSVKELRALGYKEIYSPHNPCAAKTMEGCRIYPDRPQLCRSYYCQGKY
jgi:hypothetical protein